MDPNTTLQYLMSIANRLVDEPEPNAAEVQRMAELVIALDGWLSKGGFMPSRWR